MKNRSAGLNPRQPATGRHPQHPTAAADRRHHHRFRLQNGVFILTQPAIIKTIVIKDISLGGLAYWHAAGERQRGPVLSVNLLAADQTFIFQIEHLLVRTIGGGRPMRQQPPQPSTHKPPNLVERRLQFQHLHPRQRQRLNFLLRNYAAIST